MDEAFRLNENDEIHYGCEGGEVKESAEVEALVQRLQFKLSEYRK